MPKLKETIDETDNRPSHRHCSRFCRDSRNQRCRRSHSHPGIESRQRPGVHRPDPDHIFIPGMSPGGTMTSVILAIYPVVFAGGAIITGLPYRSANTLMQAFYRVKGYGGPSDRKLDALVRGASSNVDHWPTISVWHGSWIIPSLPPMVMQSSGSGRFFTMWRVRRRKPNW
ncbi:PHB depolymerase family esterase [Phyllobacterium sp. SB3]|uniref:PHB depolymerase family esterase n=1 Tax=Phyllobacterium sp. SB3 TaxID=3156073 RepID=UPI0032AF7AC8